MERYIYKEARIRIGKETFDYIHRSIFIIFTKEACFSSLDAMILKLSQWCFLNLNLLKRVLSFLS